METQLNMNHNSITNLKDPSFGKEAATKDYADEKLALTGGRMTGSINMGTHEITNLSTPTENSNATTKKYVDDIESNMLRDVALELVKKIDIGEIDQKNEKIINLGDPTAGEDAVNMKFVNTKIAENGISATSHPKDVFRYLMEDPLQSSSESNTVVTGIVDFQQSPHKINKKAYALKINKRSSDNMFLGRLGFNMFKIPEGEYTICVEFFSWENGRSECECSFNCVECKSTGDESFCKLFQIDHSHAQMAHFSSRVSHVGFEMAGQSRGFFRCKCPLDYSRRKRVSARC